MTTVGRCAPSMKSTLRVDEIPQFLRYEMRRCRMKYSPAASMKYAANAAYDLSACNADKLPEHICFIKTSRNLVQDAAAWQKRES